jgi:ABC-type microcin C transport system permease subunit YejB
MIDEPQPQPLLPRVGMSWFFIVVTMVAIALGVARAAEHGQSLQAATVVTLIFVGFYSVLATLCFLAAFMLGAMEKAFTDKRETPANPFSDGSLPEQIVPPKNVESY